MASGWARRGFSSALRWSAVGTAGVTGIAGAQAWALHARYDPLPDARGPTRGVASPQIGRSRAETSHSAAGEALMKARDEAREFFELKVRPRLERLEAGARPKELRGAVDARLQPPQRGDARGAVQLLGHVVRRSVALVGAGAVLAEAPRAVLAPAVDSSAHTR